MYVNNWLFGWFFKFNCTVFSLKIAQANMNKLILNCDYITYPEECLVHDEGFIQALTRYSVLNSAVNQAWL